MNYTPEEYKKYGDILESPRELEERFKRHEKNISDHKKLQELYKREWEERKYQAIYLPYTLKYYKHKDNLENVNFL